MSISDLKFTEEQMASKSVTALADRPALSAAALKERLDSGDIRVRLNAVIDAVMAEQAVDATHRDQLMVFPRPNEEMRQEMIRRVGEEQRVFLFFTETGQTFWGNALAVADALEYGNL